MAYDGSGTFNRLYNWQSDAAAGIDIMADRMDAEFDGVAAGLSLAFLRDGQAAMEADADFGNHKLLRVLAPTLDTDGVNKKYVDDNFVKNTGEALITSTTPYLAFRETDVAADVSRWSIGMYEGNFTIAPRQSDGSANSAYGNIVLIRDAEGLVDARINPGPNYLTPANYLDTSILTKKTGVMKTGDQMTGALELKMTAPHFFLWETDVADDVARWTHGVSNGSWAIYPRRVDQSTAVGTFYITRDADGVTDARLTGGSGYSNTPPATSSLITRARGDARYLQLAGDTMTGDLTLPHIRLTATTDVSLTSTGHAFQIGPDSGDNLRLDTNEIYAIKNGAASALYVNASSIGLEAPVVHALGTVDATVFEVPANSTYAFAFTNGAGFAANSSGNVAVKGADENTNYFYYGGSGGPATAAATSTILSRKMADARYLQLTGGTITGQIDHDDIYSNSRSGYGKTQLNTSGFAVRFGGVDSVNMANISGLLRGYNSTGAVVFTVATNGNAANTNNSWGAISDARLKQNVVDAKPQLEDLLKMRVVNFDMINDPLGTKQIGLIAQELQAIKPGLVEEDVDGFLNIKYSVLVPILLKGFQELEARVAALEA